MVVAVVVVMVVVVVMMVVIWEAGVRVEGAHGGYLSYLCLHCSRDLDR